MRYLTVSDVLEIYSRVMEQSGGKVGILNLGALESAVAQPRATFDMDELHATVVEKAVALGYSIIQNHPFVDGNKRAGHAAMETFLMLNGYEISASVDEQVKTILNIAAGKMNRDSFSDWLRNYIVEG